ncbi:MAG: T9SS C-terminal target domain-containing protein, partial [Flavobacterium sp.]
MRNLYFFLFSGCIASAQNVVIPDTNFKAALLENDPALYHAYDVNGEYFKVDANSDGEIQNSEALEVYGLNVQSLQIADMAGVQSFSNLEMLDCSYNSITSGNFDGMNHLMYLKMNENNLTTLSLTGCTALLSVECDFNQLTAVDLSGLNSLETAVFSNNALTSITVSGLSNLSMLECTSNFLTELDLSNCANMSFLAVAYNNLTTLDLTGCHPEDVYCNGNPITNVNIKNGFDDSNSNLTIFDLPLEYICTDDFETSAIIDTLEIFGITDCSVNSYCSFTPGGIFYTVQGINRYNAANGECTNANPVYPNLKFFIAEDGGTSGTFISGESGSYQFTIPEGSYTITPMLENSSYFSISPPNLAVGFPSQANPIEQDFCIVPNGVHPDLEVTLLPLQASVPGFDAAYKIVYKNKGNQIQSGIITLTFEDNVQSLLSAAPPTVQTGNTLSWNFT